MVFHSKNQLISDHVEWELTVGRPTGSFGSPSSIISTKETQLVLNKTLDRPTF
jgi:hypothetical protein